MDGFAEPTIGHRGAEFDRTLGGFPAVTQRRPVPIPVPRIALRQIHADHELSHD
jgi:hypothetical protein